MGPDRYLIWRFIADQFEILPTIPRRTGRQINQAGHPADNPSQFWQRSMYYTFLDYYITELTARLLENGGRYQARYLIPMNLPRLTPDTVDVIFDIYKTDLRCDIVMFKTEIKRWATLTTAKPSNLKDTNEELYPSISTVLLILYTMPASTATTPERSFSVLCRLKTYLRTTMPDFFSCTACAQRHWHWHRQSCAHLL